MPIPVSIFISSLVRVIIFPSMTSPEFSWMNSAQEGLILKRSTTAIREIALSIVHLESGILFQELTETFDDFVQIGKSHEIFSEPADMRDPFQITHIILSEWDDTIAQSFIVDGQF